MSLNLHKLEKLVDLANGGKQARCPACAETGSDRKGEHLRISPEGKFGCCVFPGDRAHRKRIFALAGDHRPKTIRVKVPTAAARAHDPAQVQRGILGRLEHVILTGRCQMQTETKHNRPPDASDGVTALQTEFGELQTSRRDQMEAEPTVLEDSRTGRTGSSLLTRNANENELNSISKLKEFPDPVRSVRTGKTVMPHVLSDGTLVIPFSSPERYHWWKGGQSVRETLMELRSLKAEIRKEVEHGVSV